MSPRNLDSTMAGGLSASVIQPAVFVQLTLKSGVEYIWSGIGDFVFGGNTYKGVGDLGSVGPIGEGSSVKADGTSVTLSGIGLSDLDVPGFPTPPSPPVSPEPGESVAWAFATNGPVADQFFDGPSVFNAGLGCGGSASGTTTTGSLGIANGDSIDANSVGASWSSFLLPPEIPTGAVITRIYPVAVLSSYEPGGYQYIDCVPPGSAFPDPLAAGTNYGRNIGTSIAGFMEAFAQNTVPGPGSIGMEISFIGMAVYYLGSPQSKTSLLYEALNDIRMGAPAKIWYGLMASGALLGTPYLIFSGTVDKPTIRVDDKSNTITIALENRLVNLQRANQRRYTSADQKLAYPDDMAFDWVETLNDIALRWGS